MKNFGTYFKSFFILTCVVFLTVQNAKAASPLETPTFSIPLTINENNFRAYGMDFGIHPSATKRIDLSLGEKEYPPFPPGGGMPMFRTVDGNAILDLRPYVSPVQIDTYRIGIALDESDVVLFPMTFSWPNLSSYYSGSVRLLSGTNGSLFDIDMKAQTSYTKTSYPGEPSMQVWYVYIVAEGPLPGNPLQVISTFGLANGGFQGIVHAPVGGTTSTNSAFGVTAGTTTWFEYGPTKSYGTSTTPQLVADGTSRNISSLFDPRTLPLNTRLHFRAVAQNTLGTFYGEDRIVSNGNPPPEDTSKYRTFNQNDLSEQKVNAGKFLSSNSCFTFNNSTGVTVNSLHARFNSRILSVIDSAGFTSIVISQRGKEIHATGRTVNAGVSVTLCFNIEKKATGAKANPWSWDTNGVRVGAEQHDLAGSYSPIQMQPNGGYVRDYIYKKVITRPAGLVIGIPQPNRDSAKLHGWIRFKNASKKYFPHSLTARCFDLLVNGNGSTKKFIKEQQNPHVNKHDNLLLGDLHALKLAIVANDYGVTEPDSPATRLGDLIYNDPANSGDPLNTLTLRQIAYLADSGLTYCANFSPTFYTHTDEVISRVIQAFDGTYRALSFTPFKIAGTNLLPPFLQPNPSAVPVVLPLPQHSLLDNQPETFSLSQNYPNPFNPSTTISFELSADAFITLKIYNILGQEVATLAEKEEFGIGSNELQIDGSGLSSGVYYYRITAEDIDEKGILYSNVKKMLLIK